MANDPTVQWFLANPFGISINEESDGWNSGHVNDVLDLASGSLLAGTQSGGVWLINTNGTPCLDLIPGQFLISIVLHRGQTMNTMCLPDVTIVLLGKQIWERLFRYWLGGKLPILFLPEQGM